MKKARNSLVENTDGLGAEGQVECKLLGTVWLCYSQLRKEC